MGEEHTRIAATLYINQLHTYIGGRQMAYYIENKETGKIELHFEKSEYEALSYEQKKSIKSNFLFM